MAEPEQETLRPFEITHADAGNSLGALVIDLPCAWAKANEEVEVRFRLHEPPLGWHAFFVGDDDVVLATWHRAARSAYDAAWQAAIRACEAGTPEPLLSDCQAQLEPRAALPRGHPLPSPADPRRVRRDAPFAARPPAGAGAAEANRALY